MTSRIRRLNEGLLARERRNAYVPISSKSPTDPEPTRAAVRRWVPVAGEASPQVKAPARRQESRDTRTSFFTPWRESGSLQSSADQLHTYYSAIAKT
jgi:hypothetical protein